MIKLLQELIGIPSYSGQETKIQQFVKARLEASGLSPFFQEGNLVVHFQGEDRKRAFIFNGHVDVVDPGDINKWNYPPLAGKIVQDKIYGRGSSDMKGGIAAMMETARILLDRGSIPVDVWFVFAVEEETTGLGTKSFVNWFKSEGYIKRYHKLSAVFAEPTNLNTVKYGHRGNFFIRAEKIGVSGHSSRPIKAENHAILQMNGFINDLIKQNLEWQKEFTKSEFVYPGITPISIMAGLDSPNRIADNCQAVFDLRTIPNYHQKAFDKIRQLADERGIKLSLLYPPGPAGYTKPDARIIKICQKLIPGVKLAINDASSDLGFFTEIGIESIIFGPGDISQSHHINESADLEQILAAPKIFTQIYTDWAKQI